MALATTDAGREATVAVDEDSLQNGSADLSPPSVKGLSSGRMAILVWKELGQVTGGRQFIKRPGRDTDGGAQWKEATQ